MTSVVHYRELWISTTCAAENVIVTFISSFMWTAECYTGQ